MHPKKQKCEIKRREVFTGVKNAARRFGVSEAYVSQMLHGRRRGNKLMRAMLADLELAGKGAKQ